MEYPTIKLVFDRKKLATKVHKGLIQIEVKSGSKRKWIGTGVKIHSGEWSDTRYVVSRFDAATLNNNLITQIENIQNWINELRRKNEEFDFGKLDTFLARKKHSESFIDFLEDRINNRPDLAESTRRSHRKLIHSLAAFKIIRYFSDLTKQNIMAYDEWLHTKNYVQQTIHSYHKFLKTYIHDAIKRDLLTEDLYISIKIDRGKSSLRKYLSEQEMNMVRDCIITDASLSKVRDLFMFQCYTGLAFADLCRFDFSKTVERNGRYVLTSTRQKTGENYYIVLLSPAVEILKKYNFVLPVISNQQYNLRLKIVASIAKLDRSITSHMARHSFAVYCLNHGIQIETLAKMMGHSNINTTQI